MKLGSLFDGIGGFPLAGMMHGIEPVWASEIEPFPIAVTKKHFPNMKHLGSVTDINGAEIEPVDVITFGSPCQDLSVAGLQKGIHEGSRSNLFFEAIRIIKEMRSATNGRYPRFAVWENVPGAFSSNKGSDFQAVLQAFCEIADAEVHVPFPEKGKWQQSGCIVGDGYSVAWRVYDAQYWGVPQRRKRIYLIADFASERAGEILFECEGLRRDSETSGESWEGIAEDAQGGAGRGCGAGVNVYNESGIGYWMPGFGCLRAEGENRPSRPSTCIVGVFMGGQGEKAGGIAYSEKAAPTLRAVNSGSNQVPDIVYPDVARTLTAEHDSSPCTDRGQNVVVHAAGFNDSVGERAQGGMEYTEERSPTLRSGDVRAVVYDCRGNGGGGVSPTMTGDHQNRVTDYTAIAVYDTTQITSPLNYSNPKPGDACHPLASQQHPPLAVYPEVTGALCANSHPGSYTGQDAFNDMLPVTPSDKPPRRYIVRRLTPLECCRLQGYPDGWTENLAIENPTDEQIDFFTEVWALWAAINGTKPKSRNQVIKWLKDPQSDSAEYKAYGNSLAIPCAADVMGRVAKALREDE